MRLLALLFATVIAGCSGYQLGGPKPAFRAIEVAPIRNATGRTGTLLNDPPDLGFVAGSGGVSVM